jgi:hypothetical protein
MGSAKLTPNNIRIANNSLTALLSMLHAVLEGALTPPLIHYIFIPISLILRINEPSAIPDQVLEKIFIIFDVMMRKGWWWICELQEWEQLVMMTSGFISGIGNGKRKERDDEVKDAGIRLLLSLLSDYSTDSQRQSTRRSNEESTRRFDLLRAHAITPQFFPKIGQMISTALEFCTSPLTSLRNSSLQLINLSLSSYFSASQIPIVLPGVISTMCKVALGSVDRTGHNHNWQKGDIAKAALEILDITISKGIGDDVCIEEGAIRAPVVNLEDFTEQIVIDSTSTSKSQDSDIIPRRTPSWLRATASQIHMSLASLSSIMFHPNITAQIALSNLSHSVLLSTTLTLSSSQPLLLTYILSLSQSSFPSLSSTSLSHLQTLLVSSKTKTSILQTLLQMTQQNLSSLPRLLPSHSEAKLQHISNQIIAVCQFPLISHGVGKLLGPTGGVEKWGYSLLQVLDFDVPSTSVMPSTPLGLILSSPEDNQQGYPFIPIEIRHIISTETRTTLERMFRALGNAAGEDGLFAIEWFVGVGRRRMRKESATALWCAARLLEGVGGVNLDGDVEVGDVRRGKRLDKVTRWIAKSVAEFWDVGFEDEDEEEDAKKPGDGQGEPEQDRIVEYKKGINPLTTLLDISNRPSPTSSVRSLRNHKILHTIFSLHLLTVSSSILTSQFSSLFIYTIYPVLHSLVSPSPAIASTAQSALSQITINTSYASPSNLLLSNFDYALDDVSRRLTKTNLDVQATKVLKVLVRVVGKDVVKRAGDVVEECFDRLDEFHGYGGVVEGLVDVIGEVVRVVVESEDAEEEVVTEKKDKDALGQPTIETFIKWFKHRNDANEDAMKKEDFGPVPETAWGPPKDEDTSEAADKEKTPQLEEDKPPPLSPTQSLIQQILSRSLPFLTHPSAQIRSHILSLLTNSIPILRQHPSSILSSIHKAWPFIINRLDEDKEPGWVMSEAASLIEALALNVGGYMAQKVWDDVWPRFRRMLAKLEEADSKRALTTTRRGVVGGAMGPETVYSHSHRLHKALLGTLKTIVGGVQLKDEVLWDVGLMCRRFLRSRKYVNEELQAKAREVYAELGKVNKDLVWLVLCGSCGRDPMDSSSDDGDLAMAKVAFLRVELAKDMEENVCLVLDTIG